MNNCAPGQMAITKGAPMDNGLIVDVLAPAGSLPEFGQLWWVESKGSPFHLTPTEMCHKVVWPDCLLSPIRPGNLEDETPAVRELEAV